MRTPVRLIAVVCALFATLACSTPVSALGRHRDGIPRWVRCITIDPIRTTTCPPGHTCYCCKSGVFQPCNGGPGECATGTIACIPNDQMPIAVMCPPRGECCAPCAPGCIRLYAMVCDRCTHTLRFARRCETPHGYFHLNLLGCECRCCR